MARKLKNNYSNLPETVSKRSKLANYTLYKTKNNGVTLVELMVAISLIAILASISIPIYSDYKTRAKIGGEITKTGAVKAHINDLISMGDFNEGDQIKNIYNTPNIPQNVGIATNGIITINLGNTPYLDIPSPEAPIIDSIAAIHLVPFIVNTTLIWSCENAAGSTLTVNLLPNKCLEETLVDLNDTCISTASNSCHASSNANTENRPSGVGKPN
ncbi:MULTISPECIES: pilin [unclassified Francisella]|uniref:pilin n=1 Tax=unclassified Francisella TaxID=2610885 RepID=UPI002E30278A|nr:MULTISPECIES: prepilin-type N-terminal cleavage/methylation domain-containing protein [unclassified Francisella]MED7819090.1 prepilin-type N-terminal cleavage/methylation domain-containing protein [Francisella sp. 19S2-4]MED7829950.1 prepilin-type N-terminal cleavage/methylation domain-containing protein [Francisella sp. 19S2-10]